MNYYLIFVWLTLLSTNCICDEYPPTLFTNWGIGSEEIHLEGNNVPLQCNAAANPPVVYTWKKNEVNVSGAVGISITYRLTNIQRNQAGHYRCIAENKLGAIRNRAIKISVGYLQPPSNSNARLSRTFTYGGAAYIPLLPIEAYPTTRAFWKVNDVPVSATERMYVTIDEGIVLLNVTSVDNGKILRADLRNGYDTGNIKTPDYILSIAGSTSVPARLEPQIVIRPKDQKQTLKQQVSVSAKFECVFNARPLSKLSILWYKVTNPTSGTRQLLTGSPNGPYDIEAYNRSLTIRSVATSHAGEYQCEGRLTDGASSPNVHTARLDVLNPPRLIERESTRVTVDHGGSRRLRCTAEGIPTPEIVWYRNTIRVGNNSGGVSTFPRLSVTTNGELVFNNVQPSDVGMFQCFAVNVAGEDFQSIWVKVASAPPSIVGGPALNTKIEGDSVELTCIVSGAPKPTVKWLKDGTTISTSNPGRVQLLESTGTLLITSLFLSDTGNYVCRANNSMGTATASTRLVVLKRTKIVTPPPAHISVILSTHLSIPCRFTHDPSVTVTVAWFRNQSSSAPVQITHARSQINADGTLVITGIQNDDLGTYECRITSVAGNDSARTTVKVTQPPERPVGVTAVLGTTDQRSVQLSWVPGYDGNTPIIRFNIHQAEVSNGVRHNWQQVAVVGATERSYTITKLYPSKTYQFGVSAQNDVGLSTISVPSQSVTIPQQPPSGPPLNVGAATTSNTSITVRWEAPDESLRNGILYGYEVRFKLSGLSDSFAQVRNVTPASVTRIVLTGLAISKEYSIRVAAFNAKGVGVYSDPKMASTDEGRPTASPSDVTASPINSTSLSVSFKQPAQGLVNGINQGYKIHLECLSPPGCPSTLAQVPYDPLHSPTTPVVSAVVNLRKYAQYRITIVCYTSKGDGPKSSPAVVARTLEDVPGPVGGLNFKDIVDTSVLVEWTSPAEINGILTGFRLSYSAVNATNKQESVDLEAHIRNHTLRGLTQQTWYQVSIVAKTSKGPGPARSERLQSGVPPTLPTVPLQVTATQIQASSVLLDFIPGDPGKTSISQWIVDAQWGLIGGTDRSNWTRIWAERAPQARQLKVTGLRPYTRYRLRVTAQNVVGKSPPSVPSRWFDTLATKPDTYPAGLTLRLVESTGIRVLWRPLAADKWNGVPVGLQLSYTTSRTATPTPISLNDPNANSHLISGLSPFTRVSVKIRARNNVALGAWSPQVEETTWEAPPSAGPQTPVSVSMETASGATVQWGGVPETAWNGNLLGFYVYYKIAQDTSTADWFKIKVSGNSSQSVQLSGLRSATSYLLQVAGFNRMGVGIRSPVNPVTFTTLQDVPGPVSRLSAPRVNASWVQLAWQPPLVPGGPIQGHTVRYWLKDAAESSATMDSSLGGAVIGWEKGGLVTSGSYWFEVWARGPKGQGSKTRILVDLSANRKVPLAPTAPALSGHVTSTSMSMVWSVRTDGGASQGRVRNFTMEARKTSSVPGLGWQRLKGIPMAGQESGFVVAGLDPYSTYIFRVSATNDVGTGPFSEASQPVTTLSTTPSHAPTNVQLKAVDRTSVEVTWQGIGSESWRGPPRSYNILYGPRGTASVSSNSQAVAPGISTFILRDLTQGHYMKVTVSAQSSMGTGPASVPQVVYVGEAVPRAAPGTFSCNLISSTEVKCQWREPLGKDVYGSLLGYKIFYWSLGPVDGPSRRRRSTSSDKTMMPVTSANTAATLSGLSMYTRYGMNILAFNPAGEGPNSTQLVVVTGEGVPGPPASLGIRQVTSTSVKIAWTPPSQPNGKILLYRVWYTYVAFVDKEKKVNNTHRYEVTVSSTTRDFAKSDMTSDLRYHFSVAAQTSQGWGMPANLSVTTGPQPGAPPAPFLLPVTMGKSKVTLTWRVDLPPGYQPVIACVIEKRQSGSDKWVLVEYIQEAVTTRTVPIESLSPNTYYWFRVTAVNSVGLGYPSRSSNQIQVPNYKEAPFYQQWWFLVIIGLCAFIIILVTASILCITGRMHRTKAKEAAQSTYDNTAAAFPDDGGFLDVELRPQYPSLNSRGGPRTTGTLSSQYASGLDHSTLSRKNVRQPPRPSPGNGMLWGPGSLRRMSSGMAGRGVREVEDESEDSKQPIPSSKGSSTTGKHASDDFDSEFTDDDEFDDDDSESIKAPRTFASNNNHPYSRPNARGPQLYQYGGPPRPALGQQRPGQPVSREPSSLNPYQIPGLSTQPAGSRAPIQNFSSSFV